MGRSLRWGAWVAVAVGLTGCGPRNEAKLEAKLAALEARVAVLEKERAAAPPVATGSPSAPRAVTEAARRTLDTLRERQVSVDFTNESALRVMQVFLDFADIERVISPAAAELASTVTLKLDGSSAHAGLEAVAGTTKLRWMVDDVGIVRITVHGEA